MSTELTTYTSISEKLSQEFLGVIEPIRVSFLVCTESLLVFDCILSCASNLKVGQKKSLYEIPALLRVLCTEESVIPKGEGHLFFAGADDQICRILEWTDYIKRIAIFEVGGVTNFNEEKFIQLASSEDIGCLDEQFSSSYKIFKMGEK